MAEEEVHRAFERAKKKALTTSANVFRCKCGKEVAHNGQVCSNACRLRSEVDADPREALKAMKVPPLYLEARKTDFKKEMLSWIEGFANESHGSAFLSGSPGTGKTHAAAAIMAERAPLTVCETGFDARWISAPELLAEIRSTYDTRSNRSEKEVTKQFSEVGTLVIDDLGAEKMTYWSLSTLYLILSNRVNYMRYTIVTSNLNLQEISQWEPRIASRLGGGRSLELAGADRRLAKKGIK